MISVLVLLGLILMVGCSQGSEDTEPVNGEGNNAPASTQQTEENTDLPSNVSNSAWAKIKGWEGTVSVTYVEDKEQTIPMSDEVKKVIKLKMTGSLEGAVRFDFVSEMSDEYYLVYQGNYDINFTHDRESVSTAYVNGNVDTIETAIEHGRGTSPVIAGDDVNNFYIGIEEGTYSFEVDPSLEVERHEIIEVNGVVGHDETFKIHPIDYAFIQVSEVPLPESGMRLKGTQTMLNGSVVTWDLKPID